MWNLVADQTREGEVYLTLLRKLERERTALGGAVFDVIGKAIDGTELRRLLIEAIRYGDQPEVRARLMRVVEGALDHDRLRSLLEERSLTQEMNAMAMQKVRLEMERLEARRLQPHFIASFFRAAFQHLGGTLRERETGRYEITRVPSIILQRDRLIGTGDVVLPRYERICFEQDLITVPGKPLAEFVSPGHPLLDATLDVILERYRDLLKQGAILVDESDPGERLRALFYLEHSIQDARADAKGGRRVISRRLQFVEIPLATPGAAEADSGRQEGLRDTGSAPYLDYRPLRPNEQPLVAGLVSQTLATQDLEAQAIGYAIGELVPKHLGEVRQIREPLIAKTTAAVKDRLTKEIAYWDHRAEDLKAQEAAGKRNDRLNSDKARQRADDLEGRLRKRLQELEQERQLAALPPVAIGGALIIPGGLLARLSGLRQAEPSLFTRETQRIEMAAVAAVLAAEQWLGHRPKDVGVENRGYDIESLIERAGEGGERLRFIEVKGRIAGAETVTVSKNEILTAFNKPEDWILALVEVPPSPQFGDSDVFAVREQGPEWNVDDACVVRYVRHPFQREPDFAATSVNYDWRALWKQGSEPA